MKISFIDTNKYYSKEHLDENHQAKNKTEKNTELNQNNPPVNLPIQNNSVQKTAEIKNSNNQETILQKENNVIATENQPNSYVFSNDKTITKLSSLKSFYNYFYDAIISILLLGTAFSLFYIFRQSVNGEFEGMQTWVFPLLVFSVFIVILLIFSITAHIKNLLLVVISLSFLMSEIFAFHFFHFLAVILMIGWTLLSARQMRKALVDSVSIHFANLVRLGIGGVMFSVIVILCSQYYWMTYNQSLTEILNRFRNVKISEKFLDKYLNRDKKDGEKVKSSQISVDEFLLMLADGENTENLENENSQNLPQISVENSSKNEEKSGIVGNLLDKFNTGKEKAEEKFEDFKVATGEKKDEILVNTMRKNLSKKLGKDLKGDENIAEIFDTAMYEKVANYFTSQKKNNSQISYLALILTGLLFLSFLTLETILIPILTYLTIILLWTLKKTGVIKVVKVNRETEMIILQSAV